MKRQHVVVLMIVAMVLAMIAYEMQPPPRQQEVGEVSPEAQVEPKQEEAPIVAPEVPPEATPKTSDVSVPETTVKIKENLANARKVMQQKEAIEKAKPNEVHHMPKATVDAAKRLGEIAELEAQHPEQAASFRDFYLECARDDKTITVTRAQCADRYIKAAKLDAAAQKQFLSEFPVEVSRLVEALQ